MTGRKPISRLGFGAATTALTGALLGMLMAALPGPAAREAQAAGIIERMITLSGPRYDAVLPPCDQALDWISSQFARKEAGYWNSALAISGFDRVREVATMPWANDAIPRRFCSARAFVSDGKARMVYYSIIEDGGIASLGYGVEWCVVGLDRNWAYHPRCRAARP
jgi:hypothetical protein